jgi:hypothetical protein
MILYIHLPFAFPPPSRFSLPSSLAFAPLPSIPNYIQLANSKVTLEIYPHAHGRSNKYVLDEYGKAVSHEVSYVMCNINLIKIRYDFDKNGAIDPFELACMLQAVGMYSNYNHRIDPR